MILSKVHRTCVFTPRQPIGAYESTYRGALNNGSQPEHESVHTLTTGTVIDPLGTHQLPSKTRKLSSPLRTSSEARVLINCRGNTRQAVEKLTV